MHTTPEHRRRVMRYNSARAIILSTVTVAGAVSMVTAPSYVMAWLGGCALGALLATNPT